ncbi:MAG: type IV pilus modification PilV family protein [Gemmatimonadaceae bacterium]
MPGTKQSRCGVALLEVLLGFALLAIAGIGWITLAGQTARSLRDVRITERATLAAASTMEWVAIRTAPELDGMIGERQEGAFNVTIVRLIPALYDVTISDTLTDAPILHSSVYAPYAASDTVR